MCQETAGDVRTTSRFFHENRCLQPSLPCHVHFNCLRAKRKERRMLILMAKNKSVCVCVLWLVFSSLFSSVTGLLQALASSSWAGLVHFSLCSARSCSSPRVHSMGLQTTQSSAQLHQRSCSKQAVASLLSCEEIQAESPK